MFGNTYLVAAPFLLLIILQVEDMKFFGYVFAQGVLWPLSWSDVSHRDDIRGLSS